MLKAVAARYPSTRRSHMPRITPIPRADLPQYEPVFQLAGKIEPGLGQMVAHVASTAAGCRYCQAHTATAASHMGFDVDKIEAVWEFESHDRFTDAERAALRVARDAAQVPNAVTDEQFDALARHYDEEQIVQIVAIISLFGFLN